MPRGRRSRGKVPSETLTMSNWPGRASRPISGTSIPKWKCSPHIWTSRRRAWRSIVMMVPGLDSPHKLAEKPGFWQSECSRRPPGLTGSPGNAYHGNRMRTPRAALAVVVSSLFLAPLAWSQDSHYWTNQYGSRATLLGGAVIGSVLDLSGTYYNPGGMSLVEKTHTLLAANVFQYPRVNLARAVPGSIDLNRFTPGPAPVLLAG